VDRNAYFEEAIADDVEGIVSVKETCRNDVIEVMEACVLASLVIFHVDY